MSDGLFGIFKDIGANIQILGVAGITGAVVRALVAPEDQWRRRLSQGVAGAAAAIFIGPVLAHTMTGLVDKDVYAWLAAGFLCGYGGETVMAVIQKRVMGDKK